MLKLLGAILAAAGCMGVGLSRNRRLREGVRTLNQLIQGLALLEGEFSLRCPPLPQLMDRLSRRCSGAAEQLFAACAGGLEDPARRPFFQVWAEAVDGIEELCPEGKEQLRPLGRYLGRYESGEQCRAAEEIRRQLELLRESRQEECRRMGRVYQVLGVTGGAFLVILLL